MDDKQEAADLDRALTGMLDPGFSDTAVSHALDPRNQGGIDQADGYARYTGPCGDTMEIWVKARSGKVEQAGFCTDGCGPSIACGSMVTEMARGLEIDEAMRIGRDDVEAGLGGLPEESRHCALLSAATLKMALEDCRRNSGYRAEREG